MNERITRADLEARLREAVGDVSAMGDAAKGARNVLAPVAAVVVVAVVYLLGRRKGRKRNTVVEIRRI